jgi:glycosyltransferase involved in cell wall biosynthesis
MPKNVPVPLRPRGTVPFLRPKVVFPRNKSSPPRKLGQSPVNGMLMASKIDRAFVCGYPSDIGGANTELWHLVKLWRRFGLDVALMPTWTADPVWKARLDGIGCRTFEVASRDERGATQSPDDGRLSLDLSRVPGLPGSVVVSLCNTKFLAVADRFRDLGCRVVWLGCMNWLFPAERLHYAKRGCFDRHVFQSQYQRDKLLPQLRSRGLDEERTAVIRGAFDFSEFPFRPLDRKPGDAFPIGRISRAAADKFSPKTWEIYSRIPHPIRARILGWNAEVCSRLGPPPQWAECLPAGSQTTQETLASLGALVHAGGEAVENWPRVGLEAMAAGVPVVADNSGGWCEMIRHGETGYLCDGPDQFAYYTARLAYDEHHRLDMASRARQSLETELARPETIWAEWKKLFEEM